MMRFILLLLVVAAFASVTGCATSSQYTMSGNMPDANQLDSYVGWSRADLIKHFGNPAKNTATVLKFQKPTSGNFANLAGSVLGKGGDKATFVDYLEFQMKNDRAVGTPRMVKDTYNILEKDKEVYASVFREALKSEQPAQEAEVPPKAAAKKKAAPEPEPAAPAASTMKESKTFSNCTLKKARERIVKRAAAQGLKSKEVDGKLHFSDGGNNNITATFKPGKKDTRVELKATGSEEKISRYFCGILENCN